MKNSYTSLQKNIKDKGPEQTFFPQRSSFINNKYMKIYSTSLIIREISVKQ